MFDKLLTRAHTQAQNELDEQLCSQRQTIQSSLTALRSLGRIILDDAISDEELRARLFAAVSREELVACVDKIGEWVIGKRSDLFHGIVRRHGMLRKFSPALLDALELTQDIDGEPRTRWFAVLFLRVALNCHFPTFCRSSPYALFDA
jgi:hypothetical protein